ncbi:hypothetical protein KR084_011859 [Drosophila pseudotakahashii]|nr:hypothetical protein KR084_011859 [Drosophila pseudotakahashii]
MSDEEACKLCKGNRGIEVGFRNPALRSTKKLLLKLFVCFKIDISDLEKSLRVCKPCFESVIHISDSLKKWRNAQIRDKPRKISYSKTLHDLFTDDTDPATESLEAPHSMVLERPEEDIENVHVKVETLVTGDREPFLSTGDTEESPQPLPENIESLDMDEILAVRIRLKRTISDDKKNSREDSLELAQKILCVGPEMFQVKSFNTLDIDDSKAFQEEFDLSAAENGVETLAEDDREVLERESVRPAQTDDTIVPEEESSDPHPEIIDLLADESIDNLDIDDALAVHVDLMAAAAKNIYKDELVETEEAEVFSVGLRQDGLKFVELFKDKFGVVQFLCSCCDQAFANVTLAKNHNELERQHPVYVCHDCSACFPNYAELLEHRDSRNHAKRSLRDIEYRCLKCGSMFLNVSLAKRHEKSVHDLKKLAYDQHIQGHNSPPEKVHLR